MTMGQDGNCASRRRRKVKPMVDVAVFVEMLECDTARILQPLNDKMFLIIGWNRNTKDLQGTWFKNGVPIEFDYIEEQVIASGDTYAALLAAAMEYKRLSCGVAKEKGGSK